MGNTQNNVQESNHEPYSACTNVSLPFGNLIFLWLFGKARLRPRCAQPAALLPSHSLLLGPESAGSGRALSDSVSELPSLRVTVTVTASATEACHAARSRRLARPAGHWQLRVTLTVSPRAWTSPACGQAAAPRWARRGAGPTTVAYCSSRQLPAGGPSAGGRAAGVTVVTHRARDRTAACRSGPSY